jgi:hypothetical protein
MEYEAGSHIRRLHTGDALTELNIAKIGRRFALIDTVIAHFGGTRGSSCTT